MSAVRSPGTGLDVGRTINRNRANKLDLQVFRELRNIHASFISLWPQAPARWIPLTNQVAVSPASARFRTLQRRQALSSPRWPLVIFCPTPPRATPMQLPTCLFIRSPCGKFLLLNRGFVISLNVLAVRLTSKLVGTCAFLNVPFKHIVIYIVKVDIWRSCNRVHC